MKESLDCVFLQSDFVTMHHDAVLRDKSKIFIYKPKFTIMKRPKIEPISIVASMVFAIALILNVQANLNGDVGMFGKQLFAQTGGTGSGSGCDCDYIECMGGAVECVRVTVPDSIIVYYKD